jgi:hypothetical protein
VFIVGAHHVPVSEIEMSRRSLVVVQDCFLERLEIDHASVVEYWSVRVVRISRRILPDKQPPAGFVDCTLVEAVVGAWTEEEEPQLFLLYIRAIDDATELAEISVLHSGGVAQIVVTRMWLVNRTRFHRTDAGPRTLIEIHRRYGFEAALCESPGLMS